MSTFEKGFLATTANSLEGYRVMQTYGVVRGIVVRSRGALGMVADATAARHFVLLGLNP